MTKSTQEGYSKDLNFNRTATEDTVRKTEDDLSSASMKVNNTQKMTVGVLVSFCSKITGRMGSNIY